MSQNNSELPPGWSMPPEMEDRVIKSLNKRSSSPLDDLIEVLGDTAHQIGQVEPEPADWPGWVTYLLESLQVEAQEAGKRAEYDSMLEALRDSLLIRINGGGW